MADPGSKKPFKGLRVKGAEGEGLEVDLAAALHNLLETCSHPPAVADECLACPDWWSFDREGEHHDSCAYGYARVEAYRVIGRALTSLGLRVEQLERKPPKPDPEDVPIRKGDVVAVRAPWIDQWRQARVLEVMDGGERFRVHVVDLLVPIDMTLPADHVLRKPGGGERWYWTADANSSLRVLDFWEGPHGTREEAVRDAFKRGDAANPVVGRWDPAQGMMVQAEEVVAAEPAEGGGL